MRWMLIFVLASLALASDLSGVKSEPNLEKRSDRALDNANVALDAARDAYTRGEYDQSQTQLDEVGASVDLAFQSLQQTGKDPRRSGKFKQAEMRLRELLRRLEGLRQVVNFSDRDAVDKLRDHVSTIHDNLLDGIMSRRK